jgi:hypothetical protein
MALTFSPLLSRELNSEHEATRIEALHWFSTLLARYRVEVLKDYGAFLDHNSNKYQQVMTCMFSSFYTVLVLINFELYT